MAKRQVLVPPDDVDKQHSQAKRLKGEDEWKRGEALDHRIYDAHQLGFEIIEALSQGEPVDHLCQLAASGIRPVVQELQEQEDRTALVWFEPTTSQVQACLFKQEQPNTIRLGAHLTQTQQPPKTLPAQEEDKENEVCKEYELGTFAVDEHQFVSLTVERRRPKQRLTKQQEMEILTSSNGGKLNKNKTTTIRCSLWGESGAKLIHTRWISLPITESVKTHLEFASRSTLVPSSQVPNRLVAVSRADKKHPSGRIFVAFHLVTKEFDGVNIASYDATLIVHYPIFSEATNELASLLFARDIVVPGQTPLALAVHHDKLIVLLHSGKRQKLNRSISLLVADAYNQGTRKPHLLPNVSLSWDINNTPQDASCDECGIRARIDKDGFHSPSSTTCPHFRDRGVRGRVEDAAFATVAGRLFLIVAKYFTIGVGRPAADIQYEWADFIRHPSARTQGDVFELRILTSGGGGGGGGVRFQWSRISTYPFPPSRENDADPGAQVNQQFQALGVGRHLVVLGKEREIMAFDVTAFPGHRRWTSLGNVTSRETGSLLALADG